MVTGGDDNALCVFMVSKSCENSKYHVTEHNEQRSAHVSSITGLNPTNLVPRVSNTSLISKLKKRVEASESRLESLYSVCIATVILLKNLKNQSFKAH